jgi:hypothetical protein
MTLASKTTPTIMAALANNLKIDLSMYSLFRLFSALNQPFVLHKNRRGAQNIS